MGTATNLLVASISEGAVGAASSFGQADAMKAQGGYERSQLNTNARLEEMRAQDALERGARDASAVGQRATKVAGDQAADVVEGGVVDPNSGSAAAQREESIAMGREDAMMARNNAWREAWGHRVAAQDLRTQGRMAMAAARSNAGSTIATGGMALGRGLIQGGMLYDRYKEPDQFEKRTTFVKPPPGKQMSDPRNR